MENEKQGHHINWYELDVSTVLEKLEVDPDEGLTKEQVHKRQVSKGKNVLQPPKKVGLFHRVLYQLKDVSIIVLLIAAVLSFFIAFREGSAFIEPVAILSVVILNVILAITHEGKAEKALEALEKLAAPYCFVIRDGVRQSIVTAELVPGDIIGLDTGSIVPADARLLESTGLFSDESTLTGESEPSEKAALVTLSGNMSLSDQRNMVFTGCVITAGHGTAVITATGMDTQMGQIAGFLHDKKRAKTPLQLRLDQLSKTICWIAIIAAFFLLAIGFRDGTDFSNMLLISVSLAVAAVPETLALIVTLTLTNGVQRMVKKNVIIRKLTAVETLGNISVICSDKTGTLTQNRMSVKQLWICDGVPFTDDTDFSEDQVGFLKIFALAGNATFETDDNGNKKYVGNATEVGILRLLTEKGYSLDEAAKEYPRVAEIPFSSERKMMTVVLKDKISGYIVLTKGAFDRLPLSSDSIFDLKTAQCIHDAFAEKALRVIAIAGKHVDELPDHSKLDELEHHIPLLGLVGLIDPPRPETAISILRAKHAGIRTVMITGDHIATATAVAKELGILSEGQSIMTGTQLTEISDIELRDIVRNISVYARVSPEDKLRIVNAWQVNDEVVAMTGDGVNDAPALRAADIGIAMGKSGTEVAKSASDMILTDDNFVTIVEAVREGRNVYSNIKKAINFLLVCNLSEIIIMLFAQMAGWGILLTPVMLLLINLFGDGIPGISLAREQTTSELMNKQPVKRNASLFSDGLFRMIFQQTLFCSFAVLLGYYAGAFLIVSGASAPSAEIGRTMAFLITGITSVFHVFNARSSKSIFKTALLDNKPLLLSALFMFLFFVSIVALPTGQIFFLSAISRVHWLIVMALSLLPTALREVFILIDKISLFMQRQQLKNEPTL